METHVKVLAVLYIVLGALGVVAALGLMVLLGGAAGLIGATAEDPEALIALPIIGIAGSALVLFLLALSLPGVVAGVGLLNFRPWARILTIVLSVLNLLNIPFGTVLGAYGLWVLLSSDTERIFKGVPVTPPPIP
jgi:hypothetical protein